METEYHGVIDGMATWAVKDFEGKMTLEVESATFRNSRLIPPGLVKTLYQTKSKFKKAVVLAEKHLKKYSSIDSTGWVFDGITAKEINEFITIDFYFTNKADENGLWFVQYDEDLTVIESHTRKVQ